MCTLLARDEVIQASASSGQACDSTFDQRDYDDVVVFQKANPGNLQVSGVFEYVKKTFQ